MSNLCTEQYSATAFALLKSDLGFFDSKIPPALESHLIDLLRFAQRALLEECHIVLVPDDIYDDQLQAMYAAWLYRNKATGAGKTQALKDAIRNRQVRNATSDTQDSTEESA